MELLVMSCLTGRPIMFVLLDELSKVTTFAFRHLQNSYAPTFYIVHVRGSLYGQKRNKGASREKPSTLVRDRCVVQQ